jgi:hypothetical protein
MLQERSRRLLNDARAAQGRTEIEAARFGRARNDVVATRGGWSRFGFDRRHPRLVLRMKECVSPVCPSVDPRTLAAIVRTTGSCPGLQTWLKAARR